MSTIQTLFSAKGRMRRRDYWLWCLAFAALSYGANFAGHQILTGHPASQFFTDMTGWLTLSPTPYNLFVMGIMLVLQWPGICIAAKRWHDRNRSGYLAGAVQVFNWVVVFAEVYFAPTGAHGNMLIYYGAVIVSVVVMIWAFIEVGCLDGTKGPNQYGPSPKQIPAAADVF